MEPSIRVRRSWGFEIFEKVFAWPKIMFMRHVLNSVLIYFRMRGCLSVYWSISLQVFENYHLEFPKASGIHDWYNGNILVLTRDSV